MVGWVVSGPVRSLLTDCFFDSGPGRFESFLLKLDKTISIS